MTDDELLSLREKRKRELLSKSLQKELEQKKQEIAAKKMKEQQAKATMIVNQVLEQPAKQYLAWLTSNKPAVAQTIKDTIILILHRNMLRKPLSKIDIMKLEREITGQEPRISIKKRGREATTLDKQLKKKKELEKQ
ncbi:MAG: hypothetical protein U9O98_11190 [Asgard group archaeon]|nr:hypothetical protein [Asgard group archaeon]